MTCPTRCCASAGWRTLLPVLLRRGVLPAPAGVRSLVTDALAQPDRMQAKLQAIKQELRRSMHQPIAQQGRWLQQVVTGYFNYHAVPTNSSTLTAFLFHVTNLWRRTLRQRSQKDWTTWERIKRLAGDCLPKPRILHHWPESRFAVRHPRWEPYARIGPVRICAGGAR